MIPKKKRKRYKITAVELSKLVNIEVNPDDWESIWNILNLYGDSYIEVKKTIDSIYNNKPNEYIYKYSKSIT